MRITALETAFQITLKNFSKEIGWKVNIYVILVKGESMQSTTYIFAEHYCWASLVAQMVKNLPAMQETQVQTLGQEDSMDKGVWRAIFHGVTKSRTQLLLLLIMRNNCHHERF